MPQTLSQSTTSQVLGAYTANGFCACSDPANCEAKCQTDELARNGEWTDTIVVLIGFKDNDYKNQSQGLRGQDKSKHWVKNGPKEILNTIEKLHLKLKDNYTVRRELDKYVLALHYCIDEKGMTISDFPPSWIILEPYDTYHYHNLPDIIPIIRNTFMGIWDSWECSSTV